MLLNTKSGFVKGVFAFQYGFEKTEGYHPLLAAQQHCAGQVLPAEEGSRPPLGERTTAAGSTTTVFAGGEQVRPYVDLDTL